MQRNKVIVNVLTRCSLKALNAYSKETVISMQEKSLCICTSLKGRLEFSFDYLDGVDIILALWQNNFKNI